MPRNKLKYVFVVCHGHSGSTLLSMCLNAHPNIHVFGEFSTIQKTIRNQWPLCSYHMEECSFFDQEHSDLIRKIYTSRFRYLRTLKERLFHPRYVNYLRQRAGVDVIVDSSKSVDWAKKISSWFSRNFDFYFIFLVRDGRSVVGSLKRKAPDTAVSVFSQRWKREIDKIINFSGSIPESRKRFVRYENLAVNPQNTLENLANFLELQFDSAMMNYENYPHHICGGNAGARARVNKIQNQPMNPNRTDIDWYLSQKNPFFIDDRWKDELSEKEMADIEDEIEEVNERLSQCMHQA